MENDFAKTLAKCRNLFKYFVSHITVIPQKDTLLYYRKNQISFFPFSFSVARVNPIIDKCLND